MRLFPDENAGKELDGIFQADEEAVGGDVVLLAGYEVLFGTNQTAVPVARAGTAQAHGDKVDVQVFHWHVVL